MKKVITIGLAGALSAFLGCSAEDLSPTSADIDLAATDLSNTGAMSARTSKGGGGNIGGGVKAGPFGTCPNILYTSTKTLKNGAEVTWTSSFGGFDYDKGTRYGVAVRWSVKGGSGTFVGFEGKATGKYKTPWTPKDVEGAWGGMLTVNMTSMHRVVEPDWEGFMGNGHFKLELDVDGVDAKLGVNVHLEDPDEGYRPRCP